MEKLALIEALKRKSDMHVVISQAIEDATIIPLLLDIIETDKTAIKFNAEKIIRKISEENPNLLYPYFERIALLIESENTFIRWGFMLTLPNLLKVDTDIKWEKVSRKYLSLLDSTSIETFGNAVSGIWKILEAYPELEKDIVPKLLNIEERYFLHKGEVSPECMNIAKGQIIECFDRLYDKSPYKSQMLTFVQANLENSRKPVQGKAKRFMKKYGDAK